MLGRGRIEEDAEGAIRQMIVISEELHARIGESIRTIDDDDR
jgi:hypothetical protein